MYSKIIFLFLNNMKIQLNFRHENNAVVLNILILNIDNNAF